MISGVAASTSPGAHVTQEFGSGYHPGNVPSSPDGLDGRVVMALCRDFDCGDPALPEESGAETIGEVRHGCLLGGNEGFSQFQGPQVDAGDGMFSESPARKPPNRNGATPPAWITAARITFSMSSALSVFTIATPPAPVPQTAKRPGTLSTYRDI